MLAVLVPVAIGCVAEEVGGDEVDRTSHALTADQLACEGYDPTFAGKLSKAGLKRDGYGSLHRCYAYVKDHIAAAGASVPGSLYSTTYGTSAYQFTNWARNNPSSLASLGFKEATLGPGERPPKGSILVWGRGQCGYSAKHGHIEIVVDDGGRACSDFCGKIAQGCGSPTVFIPAQKGGGARTLPDGGPCPSATADAGRDASDAGRDTSRDGGDARTPQTDSCAGRGDGWYCSELVTYSAYQCKGQQIVLGYQCPTGKQCSSNVPGGPAVMAGAVPACGGGS